ncbi:MAG: hypothetical protein ACYDCQ_14970 [Dehalococcoidia bacterium]
MQFIVRFDRPAPSTGPDAVLIAAERYSEHFHDGQLAAYLFTDADGGEVARVRAAQVVYVAVAGTATEPCTSPPTQ